MSGITRGGCPRSNRGTVPPAFLAAALKSRSFARSSDSAGLVLEAMLKCSAPPPFNVLLYLVRGLAQGTGWLLCRSAMEQKSQVREVRRRARQRTSFTLYVNSAQQLEVQRLERDAAHAVTRELTEQDEEGRNQSSAQSSADVAKRFDAAERRFDAIEEKLARMLDGQTRILNAAAHATAEPR